MVETQLKTGTVEVSDWEEAVETCYRRGWTDGLPVLPPTRERVLRGIKRQPQEVLGIVPPRNGIATVEKIAVNAAMAGCLPEHVPVVVAALQGLLEPAFNLNGVQCTTHNSTPIAIVGGPVVKELGFHCRDGVFGGSSRASAAVGRAIRLILWNIGGAHPGEITKTTLGSPARYSYCIAEN